MIPAERVRAVLAEIRKLPYLPLYVGDWVKDPISGCSLAAQMLWMRMMFGMHEARLYGHLADAQGRPLPESGIVRLCGLRGLSEFRRGYAELVDAGVPSRTGNETYLELVSASISGEVVDLSPMRTEFADVIYSRRMVRDQRLRVIRKLVGEKGPAGHRDLVHQKQDLVHQTPDQNAGSRVGARAETDIEIDSLSQSTKSPEGVQGGGERPMAETLAVAARLVPLLGASALRDKPPDGIVHAWVRDRGYDEALIRETLTDCEDQYRGKGWRYFERILATRHDDPSQRPSRRTSRKNGNGAAHVEEPPIAVTLRARQEQLAQERPDVSTIEMLQQFVSAESWEHPSIPADAIPRYVAYIRSELHGDLTQAPTLRHFAEVSTK